MSWAHYILQANIYLVLFYGFYKLFLAKETYFVLNRIYLISAGLCSLSIPFLRFEWFSKQTVVQPIYTGVDHLNDLMTQVSVTSDTPEKLNFGNLIVIAYLIGLAVFAVLFIYKLFKVHRLLQQEHTGNAFSFFRKKRIDESLPEVPTIDRHEEIHIRQLHTLDILFFELLGIFTWFNPIIYLYKHTIKNIHEYLADEEAAKFQGDKEQYALLLLSRAFGIAPNSLTNTFFNKSLIKKRIFMLHKQRSKKTAILKYGLFLPLFAITLVLSSATIRSNENIIAVTEEIPLNTPLNVVKDVISTPIEIAVSNMKREEIIKPQNVTDPTWEDFYNYLKRGIRYPTEAYNIDLQGNSQIKFSLKDGHVGAISVVNKLGSGLETEVMRMVLSYRYFKSSQDGNYLLPVSFTLSGAASAKKNPKLSAVKGYKSLSKISVMGYKSDPVTAASLGEIPTDANDVKVYDFVSIDKQPGFPGGMERFYKYLARAVNYPVEAQEKNVQGKVFLSFIVEKNGDLGDIKVERKLGAGTDEEAVRLLKASPRWIPGIYQGKTVRVKYNIPINFSLSDDSKVPTGNKVGKVMGLSTKQDINGMVKFSGIATGKKPLVMLDGKKYELDINEINPNSISSIEVLKDASATTLYGAAGASGVILITTKTALKTNKIEYKKD